MTTHAITLGRNGVFVASYGLMMKPRIAKGRKRLASPQPVLVLNAVIRIWMVKIRDAMPASAISAVPTIPIVLSSRPGASRCRPAGLTGNEPGASRTVADHHTEKRRGEPDPPPMG